VVDGRDDQVFVLLLALCARPVRLRVAVDLLVERALVVVRV
jgi:hypothetical protein